MLPFSEVCSDASHRIAIPPSPVATMAAVAAQPFLSRRISPHRDPPHIDAAACYIAILLYVTLARMAVNPSPRGAPLWHYARNIFAQACIESENFVPLQNR